MAYMVGIDTGGTFTDLIVVETAGKRMHLFKSPTTPDDPSRSIFAALGKAAAALGLTREQFLSRVVKFAHGSTHGVNAIVQRRGAVTGALVTAGFRDTLEIRRMKRNTTFNVLEPRPEPLVRRDRIKEVIGRTDYAGEVLTPLDMDSVERAARELVDGGVTAIAVCLLHAYANAEHERQIKAYLAERYPQIYVSISSDLVQEIREYERMSTTVFNAYIGQMISTHFAQLTDALRGEGLQVPPLIMQLHGGLTSTRSALRHPVTTLFSGPVGGVVSTMHYGRLMNNANLLTMDMGGTSFDVSLVWNHEAQHTKDLEIEYFPLMLPRVEVVSIGAGGGSIAWVDEHGVLKVGPQSAGSVPGPACYGRGGTEPTVTDADVVLGYIDPDYFLGGERRLEVDRAHAAIDGLAAKLGMDRVATAAGIYRIVTANMHNAMRLMTINKGVDPRDLTGVSFGGAGGVHSAILHQELGTAALVVPLFAAGFSALGLLAADIKHTISRTYRSRLDQVPAAEFNGIVSEIVAGTRDTLQMEGVTPDRQRFELTLEMCYSGQLHKLDVPLEGLEMGPALAAQARQRFQEKYQSLYGFVEENVPIMVVGIRVDGIGILEKPEMPTSEPKPGPASVAAPKSHRQAYFDESGGFVSTPVYEASGLTPGDLIAGPAIVESASTTVVIRPGQTATVDRWLNLVLAGSEVGGQRHAGV